MFCDSDDYVEPEWCEKLLQGIRTKEDAWVVSNAYKVNFSGECKAIDDLQHHPKSETYCDIYLKYLSPYLNNPRPEGRLSGRTVPFIRLNDTARPQQSTV